MVTATDMPTRRRDERRVTGHWVRLTDSSAGLRPGREALTLGHSGDRWRRLGSTIATCDRTRPKRWSSIRLDESPGIRPRQIRRDVRWDCFSAGQAGLVTVSRPVGGVLSGRSRFARSACAAIHLCGPPGGARPADRSGGRAARVSNSTLLLVGFTEPPGHPDAGALLPHRCTLACAVRLDGTRRTSHRRSTFCCTFLRVTPTGR